MADIFSPQLKTEVSYERPVQEQQVSSPFAGLLQDIGGLFASQGGSPTTKVDPNLSAFSSDIEMVEQIRQEQGDQAANLAERKIARKFSSYGVDFDESYKSVYEKQTGRSFDLYGLDPETYFKQEQMKDPEFQKLYLASKVFNPNASEEESLAYATNQYNYIKASQASVNAKNAAGVLQWDAETETHYNSTLDNFLKNNIAALTELSNRGERIGPTYLQSLKTSFDVLLSTGLNRPRGITEEQWKPFQAKINNVEKTINSLEKLFGDETKAKEFLSALAESVRKGDGNAVAKGIMSGALASADFATLIPMVGANAFETITTVMKQPELNIRRPDILLGFQNSVAANQEAGVAPDIENQEITQFPESIVKQVQGMSPQELYQSMKANGLLVLMSNPDSMNREEGREQLENGIYKISAVLANNKEGDMLSYDFHAKLFANQGLFKTIDALEVRDPEAGRLVKASLRSGISAEIIRHDAYLDSIERSVSIAEWDGTRYVVNEDALEKTGALGRSREEFLIKLKQNYNGDLGRAVKDKFSRMQRVYLDEIRSFARGLSNLNLALDSRKTLSLLENTRKQLNKSSLDEVTVPDNTIDTLPEANLRSNADREELLGSIRETISNQPPSQESSWLDSQLNTILESEGGFQNDKEDEGNYVNGKLIGTNRGITPAALAEYRGVDPSTITVDDIKGVTEQEAREIYKQNYYMKPRINELPENIQASVLDMNINSGRNSIKILQRLAGVSDDGVIGPQTLKAVQEANITPNQYADARIEYYKKVVENNPEKRKYLNGWINRANKYKG